MRVTTNSFPDNLINNLQRLTGKMNTLQQQTSTGQRISQPSDDPAAAVRVLNYQSEQGRIVQFHRNALHALDIVNATTSEVRNLIKVSDRAGEIISLASDVQGPDAMKAYGTEVNSQLEQALVNANANFNGEPLFGGTTAATAPFTAVRDANGNITAINYAGATATASVQVAEGATLSPYSSYQSNVQVQDFLNSLVALRDQLNTGSADNVKALAGGQQTSENNLINMLSGQGAIQQRLELESSQNQTRYTDLSTQISRDSDIDLAQAIVQLTQNQNAYQAALGSAAKVLNQSLLDYV
jgi:flagellar hook-associated protein 3 FlgL